MTNNDRAYDKLRDIKVTKDFMKHAEGSCLIEFGETKVICTATVEESVPLFLKNTGKGWVTAEYGMLPRSCDTRIKRNQTSGRTMEIQRLIGRSLRAVTDMDKLGERTIKIDCDVMQADGGTRTAAITGGFIALALALKKLKDEGKIDAIILNDYVAAISVGMFEGQPVLDLDYLKDSKADMDMNVVMVRKGNFVEVQGTAEGVPFSKSQLDNLLDLAKRGIEELFEIQEDILDGMKVN
ncbi:MAG: ribonuclease PH [Omnitrophica WOR_2 bacterium GWF2_38_59]|nr:MAG: ribonuclease PH [Omnitrophica WOR_2 bacterium GWF2_38_59]OGX47201.1 MAG: ribonuclease PH [Omnitrophica WOR_2 bacterium RIFOXYA2_FULL_38_17]OGX50663.1 MAG: ribonuclease PH [Omnitrophica WOR_2 bacterium RIFOXYA12_FULL_38_10]OGX57408.1 MAG: ribonuclease PH [Omnitrophica WOR_2 bacterium RIFOXYC2_FULL_38_12]OGX59352.1 MAG: ribonuclease PH [Omnitrophica WOR_2 bacterium RIFOXYB2_FULL_38_16]HBG62356.1 ribonuclease PH [Candidatus Omnitrophota bacterium]